jgi:hypothetical protein
MVFQMPAPLRAACERSLVQELLNRQELLTLTRKA